MAYRRPYRTYNNYSSNKPVNVTLAWNTLVGAYDLKFEQIYGDEKWGKVKAIIAWIKMTIPYGERDYDDVTKVWTVHEKYFTQLRDILNASGAEFTVTIVEKPIGGPAVKFTPIDTYFKIFEAASGTDISHYSEAEFATAKKIYFRTAMRIHPDRGGDPIKMSEFNDAWDVLKERHFKIAKVVMAQTAE